MPLFRTHRHARAFRALFALLALVLATAAQTTRACDIRQGDVAVGTGTMPYITAGKADNAPVVLLVHGLFAQKEQWNDLLCALTDAGYHPIAPDLPGYGQSHGYDLSVYPLSAQVRLLGEFSRKVGAIPTHIAGNSMGGAIAALYADAHPESIRSLAFIGGTLGIGSWADTVKASILAGNNPFIPTTSAALDAELHMLLTHPPELSAELRAAILAPYQQDTTHYIQVWNIVNLYGDALAHPPNRQLPTLILWGQEDRVFDVHHSAKLGKRYVHHQLHRLPGTGHLAMIDAPALVNERYLAFLKQQTR